MLKDAAYSANGLLWYKSEILAFRFALYIAPLRGNAQITVLKIAC